MNTIEYKLDVFEGPMDLLLQLIAKKKVSVNDVSILEIIQQYLDFIDCAQTENLDIASEFLEMAARLLYIKTVSLLPVYDDETEKLVEELRGELTEYRDCKKVADKLKLTANGFDLFCKQPEHIDFDPTYTRLHEPFEIFKAYIAAIGNGQRRLPPPFEPFRAIVTKKIVSVTSKIDYIVSILQKNKVIKFFGFFESSESKSDMVAIFLALLSMTKAKRISVDGDADNPDITLISGHMEDIDFDD
ncbi:MAG: segregation/condensation protein A [Clostridiales bacterium]|nr:segregation/condensation protein A [Clostridiales bacterium]